MSFLFESFEGWKNYCDLHKLSLSESVLEYEQAQKDRTKEDTLIGLRNAWQVMKEAVKTGLEENMTSRSGMIDTNALWLSHSRSFQVLQQTLSEEPSPEAQDIQLSIHEHGVNVQSAEIHFV